MPTPTFFRLPDEKRERFVEEAINEFADRSYAEASLSQIVKRIGIAKGSVYQYFADKLDLYRWLLTEEVPRRRREFVGVIDDADADFWAALETQIERGMAFLVEHPKLARITAAAADPTAHEEVRGLHRAVCQAGEAELERSLERGIRRGAISKDVDPKIAVHFVTAITGPGLTNVVLQELGADLHEILASDELRRRLDPRRRRRLAKQALLLIQRGLGA
ncbi:TetR/AcrR family transcriptional regulator [Sandaracinus amylolyticus]|uniref:TetR/AcrR family transcriptional regulator n=1 Tax=Sandaracinus amylolyticus TaxID=927083 RepID=UPI001F3091D6|nr:TetR/AcrR family transcriptional regulator [Sandaracinus amylolyticus]UJR81381.1 TetR family transcriptional regulator [Sandaracinus amylolyticus]